MEQHLTSGPGGRPLIGRIWRGRTRGDLAEFTTISYWESMEAMEAMHEGGGDVRRVSHLPKDPDYLLELPEYVELVELYANAWRR